MAEIKEVRSSEGTGDKKIEKRIAVEEIENGFIVLETKEYKDPKKGWQYEEKKVYSKTNPLDENKLSLGNIIKKNMPGS